MREGLPPSNIQAKALVELDGAKEAGDHGAQVDHSPQEGAAGWHDLGGKAKGPDEGEDIRLLHSE